MHSRCCWQGQLSKPSLPPEVTAGAAYLVDPLNVDEIGFGMQKVIDDRTLRADMITKGIARAKDFGWEKCSRELLALFASLSR